MKFVWIPLISSSVGDLGPPLELVDVESFLWATFVHDGAGFRLAESVLGLDSCGISNYTFQFVVQNELYIEV